MEAQLAQVISCCVIDKPPKNIQHVAYGIIPYLFDFWADLVVHRILLKISMTSLIRNFPSGISAAL